jgi:hypothetical protein
MGVHHFDNGLLLEEWLMFWKALPKVRIGYDIMTRLSTYGTMRCLLEGTAHSKFDESALVQDKTQRNSGTRQNYHEQES